MIACNLCKVDQIQTFVFHTVQHKGDKEKASSAVPYQLQAIQLSMDRGATCQSLLSIDFSRYR